MTIVDTSPPMEPAASTAAKLERLRAAIEVGLDVFRGRSRQSQAPAARERLAC